TRATGETAMKTVWRVELPTLTLLASMFALAGWSWPRAPERIPVHWNLAGQVDRYAGKVEALLLMPLMAAGLYLLTWFLPYIDPGRANYPIFARRYAVLRLLIVAFMAAIYSLVHLSYRGRHVRVE